MGRTGVAAARTVVAGRCACVITSPSSLDGPGSSVALGVGSLNISYYVSGDMGEKFLREVHGDTIKAHV